MDKQIETLHWCIVTLGSLTVRVDQTATVAKPVIAVIQALGGVVNDLKKPPETASGKDDAG